MPQTVVKHLEIVYVDEQNCKSEIPVPLRKPNRSMKPIQKQSPIGKVGQSIMECTMLQQGLRPLPVGNVAVHDNQSLGITIRSGNRARSGLKNTPRTIFVADAIFQP